MLGLLLDHVVMQSVPPSYRYKSSHHTTHVYKTFQLLLRGEVFPERQQSLNIIVVFRSYVGTI